MYLHFLKKALPLPDLKEFERYLFVGPHPDDIEIGAGGFVARLKRCQRPVCFVVVTDGSSGSQDTQTDPLALTEVRRKESTVAQTILGVETIHFLDFPDGGKYSSWDVARKLAPIILEWNPDVIVAPDPLMPSEIHPDHLRTGQAVQLAALMAAYPLVYRKQVETPPDFLPEKFRMRALAFYYTHRANQKMTLDKSDFALQAKAIKAHHSQFEDSQELNEILRYLKIRGRMFGSIGKHHKEGYFVLGENHQHCFPEVNRY